MALNPMLNAAIRDTGQQAQRERPSEDGGRDWSAAPQTQDAWNPRIWRGGQDPPLKPLKGAWPGTLVSYFWPRAVRAHISVLGHRVAQGTAAVGAPTGSLSGACEVEWVCLSGVSGVLGAWGLERVQKNRHNYFCSLIRPLPHGAAWWLPSRALPCGPHRAAPLSLSTGTEGEPGKQPPAQTQPILGPTVCIQAPRASWGSPRRRRLDPAERELLCPGVCGWWKEWD